MKQLLADLRALGLWAPLRALYEISRRLGITGRVLLVGARRPRAPALASPFPARPVPGTRLGWVGPAEEIESLGLRVFGRTVRMGHDPDWHTDGDGRSWPRRESWRIDLYADENRDVKQIWELGRHRHLVVLARAAVEAPDHPVHMATLARHLRTWLDQNPPEMGVHWYSNLELALRALAWLEVFHLVGERLEDDVRSGMAAHLYHSGRHIVSQLPYTVSSMRNNHLIGDAVGLVAIGRAFPNDRRARRWVRLGDRLLRWHVPRHVAADGSSIEDSLGYRGFVLELLAARVALGGAPGAVTTALRLSRRHLSRLGAGSGPVPHFGDWDGGTAIVGRPGRLPPDSSVEIAGAVLGEETAVAGVVDGRDAGGGMGRIERGPWTVWLKAGAADSHEHADLLSVSVRFGHRWVVGDPGNGSYNRSADERDYFRTSVAHSVLRVGGRDQRVPHRRFRWRYHPDASLGTPFDLGHYRVMWGAHNAYERLNPPRRVLRAALVNDRSVVVADWVVGEEAHWALSVPLGPDVVMRDPDTDSSPDSAAGAVVGNGPAVEPLRSHPAGGVASRLVLPSGTELGLLLPGPPTAVRGSVDPYDGWWADDYDVVRPAIRLDVHGRGSGPVLWAVWTEAAPELDIEGGRLVVDGNPLGVRQREGLSVLGEIP